MTTTIRDINELQDRRIMMEKKLPPFGYALILLTAALILFLVVWSTKNYRTYVSQSSGSVQAANKTYIMSSYSGSITELNIAEGSYVNEGDLIAHITMLPGAVGRGGSDQTFPGRGLSYRDPQSGTSGKRNSADPCGRSPV